MQQVNVAWDVLSDPTKKREYDKKLKGSSTSRSTARQSTARPATTATPRPASSGGAQQRSTPRRSIDDEPGDGSVSIWASMPVLLVVGLLLGILILAAFAGDVGESTPEREPNSTAELNVGDCFALVADTPRERSCASGTADGQVIELGPEPGNCPANTQSLRDPRTNFFLCWARMVPGSSNTVPPEG